MTGRILGIDFGTRRVGLAVADPLQMFAQPLGTYHPDEAVVEIERIQRTDGISVLVVGWPLLPDGTEGKATERVQQFINRIVKRAVDARVVKWDERHTTQEAKEMIKAGSRPSLRSTGRERLDTAAAGIILQQYLDER